MPIHTAFGEDGFQVAFKQSAGVLEVLFGIGFGGGEAFKRFVEDANDAVLFRKFWKGDFDCLVGIAIQITDSSRMALHPLRDARQVSPMQKLVQETKI